MDLAAMKTRDVPESIEKKELEPRHNPRMCCFDTSSVQPAWTATVVCGRSKLINELSQGEWARTDRGGKGADREDEARAGGRQVSWTHSLPAPLGLLAQGDLVRHPDD